MRIASRAKNDYSPRDNQRNTTRPHVRIDPAAVRCGKVHLPDRAAALEIECLEDFPIVTAMKDEHPIADDSRSRITLPYRMPPGDGRGLLPAIGQSLIDCVSIALRSQNLGPVARSCLAEQADPPAQAGEQVRPRESNLHLQDSPRGNGPIFERCLRVPVRRGLPEPPKAAIQ